MAGIEAFKVLGLRDLDAQLADLDRVASASVLRQSVRAALQPALKEAKRTLKPGKGPHKTYRGNLVQPGFAKKSIRIKVVVSRKTGLATGILGVRKEAFYATQFIELGTSRQGKQPWLRPAFSNNKERAVEIFRDKFRASIVKAIARKSARAATR